MYTLQELTGIVEENIKKLEFPTHPVNLYSPVRYILNIGGKRIRPAALLLAFQQYGGKAEDAIPLGMAVEVFHNFTLMHDDIMDRAPLRRGMPTVHEKWNTTVAILSGDAMMVRAYELLAQFDSPRLLPILHLFNTTARQVCEGQQLDMDFEDRPRVSIEDYLEMIGLKTAVLLAGSLRLGALAAGAGSGDEEAMFTFGYNLGLAFQLQDDLLDCFGDAVRFGKQAGGDILANKKTWLLLKAFELADEIQRRELDLLIGGPENKNPEKIQRVMALYHQLEVEKHCTAAIAACTQKALSALDNTTLDPTAKEPFFILADALLLREY